MATLSDAVSMGAMTIRNRLVMAPVTRIRTGDLRLSSATMTADYAHRTPAGLIITEGIQPSGVARPGLGPHWRCPEEEVATWRQVTSTVHSEGTVIFSQILDAVESVSPSVPARPAVPWELSTLEITDVAGSYATAAQDAIAAGFDGVEIHAASGSQFARFLSRETNQRVDRYGGRASGRIRFLLDAVGAATDAVGANRVGLRLSPGADTWNTPGSDEPELYGALLARLAPLGLAYVHLTASTTDEMFVGLRGVWPGALIASPSALADPVPRPRGDSSDPVGRQVHRWLAHGADLISLGRPLLHDPALVGALGRDVDSLDLVPVT